MSSRVRGIVYILISFAISLPLFAEPNFDPGPLTLKQFLEAREKPEVGMMMVYMSTKGNLFFGKVLRIYETSKGFQLVEIVDGDTVHSCPLKFGVWVNWEKLR
jgi:hypothetical protein